MIVFISLAGHAAVAYLHLLLSWRFYPQRKDNYFVHLFWYLMALSFVLHAVYALYHIALVFEATNVITYLTVAGYILLAFYPAILATLFLGELVELPNKKNVASRYLSLISRNTNRLFITSMFISISTIVIPILVDQNYDYPTYSFGNIYAFLFMLGFSLLWLLMFLSGMRPAPNNDKYKRSAVGYGLAISIFLLLSFISFFIDVGFAWSLIPIISTTGLSLSFCWYRFRTQFMDVIISQFFRILMLIVIVIALNSFLIELNSESLKIEVQLLSLAVFLLLASFIFLFLNKLLSGLWLPSQNLLSMIHTELPIVLNQCSSANESIEKTESFLSNLFTANVSINKRIPNITDALILESDPKIHIQLSYRHGWIPWFSESLSWVKTAGLYLQNHLITLQTVKSEHEQQLKTQELRGLASKAELIAMRSQIRPHFLFNCLNSIHSYITSNPQQAERMIEELAELIRGILKMSDKDEVPMSAELELVDKYLGIEKQRYGEQLQYKTTVTQSCKQFLIPSFSIQPLVENAIKYGVDSQFEPVSILIDVSKNNGFVEIKVTDDGPGLAQGNNQQSSTPGLGIATQNIQGRLTNLYGEGASLSLLNGEVKGAVALIRIPAQV